MRTSFPTRLDAATRHLDPPFAVLDRYVAVHQYLRMPHEPLVRGVRAHRRVGRRPAARGNLHSLGAEELRPLDPRFDDFRAVRDAVDPGRGFSKRQPERVLGS